MSDHAWLADARSSYDTVAVSYADHVRDALASRRPSQVSAWLREAGFTVEAEVLLDMNEGVPGAILFARCGPGAG